MSQEAEWSPSDSVIPVGATALLFAVTFTSMAKPNPRRMVTVPTAVGLTAIALFHSRGFSPDPYLNEIFNRFLFIYMANASFYFCMVPPCELEEERRSWVMTSKQAVRANHGTAGAAATENRQWVFAYRLLLNPLCYGTRWEVPPRGDRAAAHKSNRDDARLTDGQQHHPGTSGSSRDIAPNHTPSTGGSPRSSPVSSDIRKSPTPHHSLMQQQAQQRRQEQQPSRKAFVFRRLLILLLRYIALCLFYDPALFFRLPGGFRATKQDYAPIGLSFFFSRLPDLAKTYLVGHGGHGHANSTTEQDHLQTLLRPAALRLHWVIGEVVPDNLTLSSYHDILAIIGVATGLDQPSDWPSLYGSIFEAYTVRRYWALYWHRLIYRSFSAYSRSFLSLLGFSKKGSFSRYAHNALVFVLSGVMHELVQWLLQPDKCMRCGCRDDFWFYTVQVLGLLVEALFQACWKGLLEKRLLAPWVVRSGLYRGVKRVVGYLWVVGWLMWVAEVVNFPVQRCMLS